MKKKIFYLSFKNHLLKVYDQRNFVQETLYKIKTKLCHSQEASV
jgi:hypothetical protein